MEEARKVRWALAMAIDRELINETLLLGMGGPSSVEYIAYNDPNFQERWRIPYDPDRARKLLAETRYAKGFDVPLQVGGEVAHVNPEIADAVAGMFAKELGLRVAVLKTAFSIYRPSMVQRTATFLFHGDCDEGGINIPFDWPHGLTETSLTRGGFGCGIEIPFILDTYRRTATEPDISKRIEENIKLIDYLYDQMLIAGTVTVPAFITYNPKAIKEWKMVPNIFVDISAPVNIVPAR